MSPWIKPLVAASLVPPVLLVAGTGVAQGGLPASEWKSLLIVAGLFVWPPSLGAAFLLGGPLLRLLENRGRLTLPHVLAGAGAIGGLVTPACILVVRSMLADAFGSSRPLEPARLLWIAAAGVGAGVLAGLVFRAVAGPTGGGAEAG